MKNEKILIIGKGKLGIQLSKLRNSICIGRPEIDITSELSIKQIIYKYNPNILINTAAITDLTYCELNKLEANFINITSAKKIAKICKLNNIYSIQISSDNAIDPINHYGYTKLKSEDQNFSTILRTNFFDENHWLIKRIKNKQISYLINNNSFNPVHISTVVCIINELIKNKLNGLYQLGLYNSLSYYDFGLKLQEKYENNNTNLIKKASSSLNLPYKYALNCYLKNNIPDLILQEYKLNIDLELNKL